MLESFQRRLQHRFFPVNIAKFLRTPISIEHYPMVAFEVSFYRVVSGNRTLGRYCHVTLLFLF